MTLVLEGRLAERGDTPLTRCPVVKALSVMGTRSAFVLLREAFYGTRRFDDFVSRAGVTDAVAAARLRELTDAGLLTKEPYREVGQRTRYEYQLTDMGRDLLPAMVGLMQWGDRYLQGDLGPALVATHTGCDEPIEAEIRCAGGHKVDIDEITLKSVARRASG